MKKTTALSRARTALTQKTQQCADLTESLKSRDRNQQALREARDDYMNRLRTSNTEVAALKNTIADLQARQAALLRESGRADGLVEAIKLLTGGHKPVEVAASLSDFIAQAKG